MPDMAASSRQTTTRRRTIDDLLRALARVLPELAPRYGLRRLSVFGSYVSGKQRARSDLDLLADFGDAPLSLLGFIELENQLSDELGVPVDLVEDRALKPLIGRRIRAEAVQVWPKKESRHRDPMLG